MSQPDHPNSAVDRAERAARVLWNPAPSGSRGPRPALTRAQVVGAGISVADREGLQALSMRAVADVLKTSTTGLYRYVPGRAELVALMAEEVLDWISSAEISEGDWRTALETLAHEDWRMYRRHPWMLDVRLGEFPPGPNTVARFDAGLAAVLRAGLPEPMALTVATAVDHVVIGAARRASESETFTRHSGMSPLEWWRMQGDIVLFERMADGAYPALARLIDAQAFETSAADMEAALALVLDGVERMLDR